MPYPSCLANGTGGGDEFMGSAAERLQLITGITEICGLVKPSAAAHKKLVGADNERVLMMSPYLPCLGLREGKGTVGGCSPVSLKDALDCCLIHRGGFDTKFKAGSGEQLLPARARRREN